MANIEKRPISDLITIVDNYYNTHSIPNNVSRKEEIKVLKNLVFSLQIAGIKTLGEYRDAENKNSEALKEIKANNDFLPEHDLILELAFTEKLTEDLTIISIDSLDLPTRIKNALKNNGITNLEELLDIDYSDIKSIKNFGPGLLLELKIYIHSLGYYLKGEEETIEDKRAEYESQGKVLVQDEINIREKVVNALNRNGIFTLQELIKCGEKVYHLNRMGKVKADELREALAEKGIYLEEKVEEPVSTRITEEKVEEPVSTKITEEKVEEPASTEITEEKVEDILVPSILPSDDIIEQLKQENQLIRKRIEQKEKLLSEYEGLIEEKKNLIKQEQELDKEIAKRLETLQSLKNKEEGLSYGGK